MYRILVTGSRSWTNEKAVSDALVAAYLGAPSGAKVVVVHGDCPTGTDALAEDFCQRVGILTEAHPAMWQKKGKAAGYIRNREMVELGADVCLAFWKNQRSCV